MAITPTGTPIVPGTTSHLDPLKSSTTLPIVQPIQPTGPEAQKGLVAVEQPSRLRQLVVHALLAPVGMASAAMGGGSGTNRKVLGYGEQFVVEAGGVTQARIEFRSAGGQWGFVTAERATIRAGVVDLTPGKFVYLKDGDQITIGEKIYTVSCEGKKGVITVSDKPSASRALVPVPPPPVRSRPPAAARGTVAAPSLALDDLRGSGEATMAIVFDGFGDAGTHEGVIETIRRETIRAASGHTHRDSPTAGVFILNHTHVRMRFDLDTGRALAQGEKAANEAEIVFFILPDTNEILLTDATKQGLKWATQRETDPARKRVLATLLSAHGLKVVDEGGRALARRPEVEVLTRNQGLLRFNQGELETLVEEGIDDGMMTVCIDVDSIGVGVTGSYRVGTLQLDASGHIVGIEVRLPNYETARGTTYRSGFQTGSNVAVIVCGSTILWHGPTGHLNTIQAGAFFDLYDAMRAEREAQLRADPYAVEAVLGDGMGPMILDMAKVIGFTAWQDRERQTRGGTRNVEVVIARQGDGTLRAYRRDKGKGRVGYGIFSFNTELPEVGSLTLRIHPVVHTDKGGWRNVKFEEIEIVGEIASDAPEATQAIREVIEYLKTQLLEDYEPDQDDLRTVHLDAVSMDATPRAPQRNLPTAGPRRVIESHPAPVLSAPDDDAVDHEGATMMLPGTPRAEEEVTDRLSVAAPKPAGNRWGFRWPWSRDPKKK